MIPPIHFLVLKRVNKARLVHQKGIVENDVAIYLSYDVIFYEDDSINFYVDGEPVRVETCTYLFVDLYEDVIGGFLYASFTILF